MAAPTAAADTTAPPPPPPAVPEPAEKVYPHIPPPMSAPTAAADNAAPPPPTPAPEPEADVSHTPSDMAVPSRTADTAALRPPSPVPEPAAKVSHTPHMSAPTAAANTPAPPPAPPVPEPAAKVSHALPPTPPLPDAPAPRKRKLEEAGFHTSAYYKIRSTVADLRLRFVQVCEATDFRNSDAARDILKEIKIVMELCKKTRLDLNGASEPVKPSYTPSAGAVKDGPAEPIPSGESNQVNQAGQTAISPNNANDGVPPQA